MYLLWIAPKTLYIVGDARYKAVSMTNVHKMYTVGKRRDERSPEDRDQGQS